MANAIKDQNHVPSLLALSYVDGTTLVPIKINSSDGSVKTDNTHTVSTSAMNAARDSNFVTTLMAEDSVSGGTIPVFANPTTGGLLIGTA